MLFKFTKFLPGVVSLFLIGAAPAIYAEVLPQYDQNIHKGVANCTTSSCHGRSSPKGDGELPQNEYRRWAHSDLHAKTYETLLGDAAQKIADNLGIVNPATADLCLDCHTDNPAEKFQGKKFSYDDGIGCEACHGGSQRWLSSHTAKQTPHADNLANGMYPTDDPVARTELCISCHLGHPDKIADHKIMGAGHPRLRFEMSAYTTNMTPHYENSDWDIQRGKQTPEEIDLWFLGMLGTSQNITKMWLNHLSKDNWSPELSLFDCHSCHHSMNDLQWQPSRYRGESEPGVLRLNTAQIEILSSVLQGASWTDDAKKLRKLLLTTHKSGGNIQKTRASARALKQFFSVIETRYINNNFSEKQLRGIRTQLITDVKSGAFNSFMLAEQAFLSIETLSLNLGDEKQYKSMFQGMMSVLISEDDYDATAFQHTVKPAPISAIKKPQQAVEVNTYYVVTADSLNVRQQPSRKATVLKKIFKQTKVQIYERHGEWARISEYGAGSAQWVAAGFLSAD